MNNFETPNKEKLDKINNYSDDYKCVDRLTKRNNIPFIVDGGDVAKYSIPNHNEIHTATQVANKLGRLEDIEEEINVGLVKLFSTKTIWCRIKHVGKEQERIEEKELRGINLKTREIHVWDPNWGIYDCRLNSYGTDWAFTKEELENE